MMAARFAVEHDVAFVVIAREARRHDHRDDRADQRRGTPPRNLARTQQPEIRDEVDPQRSEQTVGAAIRDGVQHQRAKRPVREDRAHCLECGAQVECGRRPRFTQRRYVTMCADCRYQNREQNQHRAEPARQVIAVGIQYAIRELRVGCRKYPYIAIVNATPATHTVDKRRRHQRRAFVVVGRELRHHRVRRNVETREHRSKHDE